MDKAEKRKRIHALWYRHGSRAEKHYGYRRGNPSYRVILDLVRRLKQEHPEAPSDRLEADFSWRTLWTRDADAWKEREAKRCEHAEVKRALKDKVFRKKWTAGKFRRLRRLTTPPKLVIEELATWHARRPAIDKEVQQILEDLCAAEVTSAHTRWRKLDQRLRQTLRGQPINWGHYRCSTPVDRYSSRLRSLELTKAAGLDTKYRWDLKPAFAVSIETDRPREGHGWRLKEAKHEATIPSFALVEDEGQTLAVYFMGEPVRRKPVPEGYFMRQLTPDRGIELVRKSDGMEIHPSDHWLLILEFRAMIQELESNSLRRKRLDFERAFQEKGEYFLKDLPNTRVHWADSIGAGNCEEGSGSVARVLRLRDSQIMFNTPGISAERLMAFGRRRLDGGHKRLPYAFAHLEAACFLAWLRETEISI